MAIGGAIGATTAVGLSRFVQSLVFGLTPSDPITIAVSLALFAVIGLLAGYLPARRAARIDPPIHFESVAGACGR